MPAIAAAPLFWGAVATAGATAATQIYAANKQAGAARESASAQTNAANRAADLKAKADAEALAFTREQAVRDQANFETTQHANYDQWAARERRIGTLGGLIGAPSHEIPGYRSTVAGDAPASGGADPKLAAAIAAYQAANPASAGIAPLTAALKQQGFNVDRFMYGQTPSDNELSIGGQKYKVLGGEKTPGAYWYQPGMDDSAPGARAPMLTQRYAPGTLGGFVPMSAAPLTQPLAAPRYPPGSLGYFGGY